VATNRRRDAGGRRTQADHAPSVRLDHRLIGQATAVVPTRGREQLAFQEARGRGSPFDVVRVQTDSLADRDHSIGTKLHPCDTHGGTLGSLRFYSEGGGTLWALTAKFNGCFMISDPQTTSPRLPFRDQRQTGQLPLPPPS
jgi:hypothetical protein